MTEILPTGNEEGHDLSFLENVSPRSLPETSIPIYTSPEEKEHPPKPPPTPVDLVNDCYVTILPKIPDSFKEINLPYVREAGIRCTIDTLAPFFSCYDYPNNLIEFWFLDFVVDCIWKSQDEFRFSVSQQKQILEWLMCFLKIIGLRDITKEMVFEIIEEAVIVADEYLQAGGSEVPSPYELFTFDFDQSNVTLSSLDSSSLITGLNMRTSKQYIVVDYNEVQQVYKLPTKRITADCLSSTVQSVSDQGIYIEDEQRQISVDTKISEEITPTDAFEDNELQETVEKRLETDDVSNNQSMESVGVWYTIPRKKTVLCPSRMIIEPVTGSGDSILISPEKDPNPQEIFKAFYDYNIWILKNEYINNSKIGWTSLSNNPIQEQSKIAFDRLKQPLKLKDDGKLQFVESCLLMTVRQIVFDYFDSEFAFQLAKIALTNPQFLITQDINVAWNVPKDFKQELKKPAPKKPKKEKVKKEKTKKDKKEKKKSKSDKKSSKKSSKKSEKKTSKKSNKSDKEGKKPKMTKEEKEEYEKKLKEQKQLEEELRIQYENTMFMFPLNDAVNIEFLVKLFPNFKPKKAKGKGEKEKGSKSNKSSKKTGSSKK